MHPTRRSVALLAGASALVAVGTGTVLALTGDADGGSGAAAPGPPPASSTAPTPAPSAAGPAVTPTDPAPSAVPEPQTASAPPGATTGVRLRVPSVGLDLPVLPMEPEDGVIDPPTLGEAYWIDPYGDPVGSAEQAQNTLYITGHSWARGDAAFNPLLDRAQQRGAVEAGDVVTVATPGGSVDYTVESTRRYAKGELPGAGEVWDVVPGRLVLITCFQRDDGQASTENFVVVASA